MPKVIPLESITQQALSPIKVSRQRGVYRHQQDGRVYKLWDADWEFANHAELGWEYGCYDEIRVPNFVGFIKDASGKNRGYVMEWVPYDQRLEYIGWFYARKKVKKILNGELSLGAAVIPSYHLSRAHLQELIRYLFSRAQDTGWLFTGIDLKNLWLDKQGYHLFDLDALRHVDWLFGADKDDPERERKKINREVVNRELTLVLRRHGLPPIKLTRETINQFS